jgi:hypothetical protein
VWKNLSGWKDGSISPMCSRGHDDAISVIRECDRVVVTACRSGVLKLWK